MLFISGDIFVLTFFARSSVVTIVRFKYIVDFQRAASVPGLAAPAIVQTTLTSAIYSILEIGLGILTAALVAIRPLARVVRDSADKYIGIDRASRFSQFYLSFRRTPPPTRDASRRSTENCTENVEGTTCAGSRGGEMLPEEHHAKIDDIGEGREGAARLGEKVDLESGGTSSGGHRNCRAEGS